MTSFDPRTWHVGHATPSMPQPISAPQPEPHTGPGEPARATGLGLALSALILTGGAFGAYAMRPPAAAPLPVAFNLAVSPNG